MNVTISDDCLACGACESICDAVFSVEDKAIVNAANIAGNEDAIQEAAGACPVSAIVVEQSQRLLTIIKIEGNYLITLFFDLCICVNLNWSKYLEKL